MIADTKIRIWRDETRPTSEVPFWDKTADDESYFETTYKAANLFISEELTISDDQLTRTRSQLWRRVPGIVVMLNEDPTLAEQLARNTAHNDEHGITRSIVNYEIIDENNNILVSGILKE